MSQKTSSTSPADAKADRAILDAAAYLDREPTSNLADFATFAVVSGRASTYFAKKSESEIRDAARLVGLYSRYQDAKRSNVLPTILDRARVAPKSRAPRSVRPTAPKKAATPVAEPKAEPTA